MEWERYERDDLSFNGYYHIFRKEALFGKIKFRILASVNPDLDVFIGVSSGRKRKQLEIFEDKGEKNIGCGIEVLKWIKQSVLEFPEWHANNHSYPLRSLQIQASDKRRWEIYKRSLVREGFYTQKTRDGYCLYKKLNNI